MVKSYFMGFDYFKPSMSKYYNAIFYLDLTEVKLIDVAKSKIKELHPECNVDDFTIKINTFNNVH